jgi:hypothetical protein
MEEYEITKPNDLSQYSSDQLIAVVKAWAKNLPAWMVSLRTMEVSPPIGVPANVAWAELLLRDKKQREIASVKGAVEAITTDKVLVYSPEKSEVKGGSAPPEPVVNYAGHLVKESRTKDPSFNALIAAENFIDAMMFPIQKYNSTKDAFELSDRAQVGAMQFPEFPIMDLAVKFKINDPNILRKKLMGDAAKFGVAKFTSTIVVNFPEKMKYNGNGTFSLTAPTVYKSDGSVGQMYKQIHASRKLRGSDNNMNSALTRGYYYGYMSAPMYRAFHTVSDIMRVLRTTGIKVLRIPRQSGIFNSVVVWSLIANGVYIHSDADSQLDVCDLTQDKPAKPGIYSKVKTDGLVLKFFELNDRFPEFKNGVTFTYPVLDRLNELPTNTNIKYFTILYLRDELRDVAMHLMPSAHAHSGQVIWVQTELKEALNVSDYAKRVVAATSYKCYAAYCRSPWILKDPYAYKESFRITQKSLRGYEEFEKMNFEVSEDFIEPFKYDVDLGDLSDSVKEMYKAMASENKEKKKEIVEAKQIMYVTESIAVEVASESPSDSFALETGTDIFT